MSKELLVKVLTFLKEEPELKDLTINEVEKRFYDFESFLISLIEEILQDKPDIHGTLTAWWLYDNAPKVFYVGEEKINVESAKDFVNYMIESNVKD